MNWLILIVSSMLASTISVKLSIVGLKRLRDNTKLPLAVIWTAGCISTIIGIGAAITAKGSASDILIIASISVLVTIVAIIDAKTLWAPTELMFPICVLAGAYSSMWLENSIPAYTGLLIFMATWMVWWVHNLFCKPHLPPADVIVLILPIIMLNRVALVVYYCGLATSLILVRSTKRLDRILIKDNKIPLLALAFPWLLICLWSEVFLLV